MALTISLYSAGKVDSIKYLEILDKLLSIPGQEANCLVPVAIEV